MYIDGRANLISRRFMPRALLACPGRDGIKIMQHRPSIYYLLTGKSFLLTLALLLGPAAPIHAQLSSNNQKRFPFKPSDMELMALPDYCKARLGHSKEAQQVWVQHMGKENFMHLHHYCYGLNYVNRIKISSGSKHKKHYVQTGLAQFNYVLARWPDGFYLKPEAQSYKAQLEFQLQFK
jgi:hypothetical protein